MFETAAFNFFAPRGLTAKALSRTQRCAKILFCRPARLERQELTTPAGPTIAIPNHRRMPYAAASSAVGRNSVVVALGGRDSWLHQRIAEDACRCLPATPEDCTGPATNRVGAAFPEPDSFTVLEQSTGCARLPHVNQHSDNPAKPSEAPPQTVMPSGTIGHDDSRRSAPAEPEMHSGDCQWITPRSSDLRLYR